jgi:uncharacterized protein (TIGR04255 family)
VRGEFPTFNSAPYAALGPPQPLFIIGAPRIRGLYTSADQSRLLQIQDDLIFVNWRKTTDDAQYVRYASVRSSFVQQWHAFVAFLAEFGIHAPLIHRYQVSYVNHSREGQLLPGDLLTEWRGESKQDVSGLSVAVAYHVDESGVDVSLNLQPAIRMIDASRVIQLTITTSRVVSPPSADPTPEQQLDVLHDCLIETFETITSENARALWKRV